MTKREKNIEDATTNPCFAVLACGRVYVDCFVVLDDNITLKYHCTKNILILYFIMQLRI